MKKRHAFEQKKLAEANKKEVGSFSAKEKAAKRAAKAAGEERLAELVAKHAAELAALTAGDGDEGGAGGEEKGEKVAEPAEDAPSFGYAPAKMSKAARKRLEREEREARDLEERRAAKAAAGPSKGDRETAALAAKVASLGMKVVHIAPDGHCLYASVAHAWSNAGRSPDHTVASLRSVAASHIRAHSDDFAPFIIDTTVEEYTATLEGTAEWGGELELRALAAALPAHLVVHQFDSPNPLQIDPPADEGSDEPATLHLAYQRSQYSLGEHYNAVVPSS